LPLANLPFANLPLANLPLQKKNTVSGSLTPEAVFLLRSGESLIFPVIFRLVI